MIDRYIKETLDLRRVKIKCNHTGTRVIALDLHAPQIQGFFDIPIDHLMGVPILGNYFEEKNFKDVVIVSPDHGGVYLKSEHPLNDRSVYQRNLGFAAREDQVQSHG